MQCRVDSRGLAVNHDPLAALAAELQEVDVGGAVDLAENRLAQYQLVGIGKTVVALGFQDHLATGHRKRRRITAAKQPGDPHVVEPGRNRLGNRHHERVGHRSRLAARHGRLLHRADARVRKTHRTQLVYVRSRYGHLESRSDPTRCGCHQRQTRSRQLGPSRHGRATRQPQCQCQPDA